MFQLSVLYMTLQKVAFLLLFIFVGYFLRRRGKVTEEAASALSVLTTYIFAPAYTAINLPKTFTIEKMGSNASLVGFSLALLVLVILVARFLAAKLGRDGFEKRTLSYMFTFSNTGYFGYPVIQGVFGEEILGQFMLFCLPLNLAIYSYGYSLFASEKGNFQIKKVLLSPLMIGCYAGCILGISGFSLPGLLRDALESAGACMSPASMLLAGIVMGAFPLKKLLSGARPYLLALVRLIGMPLLFGIPLSLLGIRGIWLFLALAVLSMPSGMNIVVYPESLGQDASGNAKICFVSTLLSIVTLPVSFALIGALSGLNV